jgi:oligoendopeptidase F
MHSGCRLRREPLVALATFLACLTAAGQDAVPTRDQIPERYKWDLATMYADLQTWEADFARAERMLEELEQRKAVPFQSPAGLLETLTLREEARWLADKLRVYAQQLSDQDARDNQALALKNRATGLWTSFEQATAWIEPKLLTFSEGLLRSWCRENPDLGVYRHYLESVIRRRPYLLSSREEELLAMVGNLAASPEETYGVLKYGELIWPTIEDEQGNQVELSPARFSKFIRSADGRLRRDAFLGMMAAHKRFENTLAATLNGAVQRDIFCARARGFESALEASLFLDYLPLSVYTKLVATVNANLPLQHRWAALRKRVLGLDELHVYDLYQPLTEGGDREIEYEDAVAKTIVALRPLGAEYCGAMEQGFASRWIDVYETKGKCSGAYSSGSYGTQPYILLNYNKTLAEASTIAHEMGHSMHRYFTHKHQPQVYGEYSGFVAEVAAVFNEILLEDHLLKAAETRTEKLRLLNHAIDNLRGTVFRQVMFAEFEAEIHAMVERGEALTAARLGELHLDTFHKYWGRELVRDAEHASYWACIPHYYLNFYVYRYATSYCAAAALAHDVLAEKPGAREAYLGFLKAGSSDYPLEILRKAGVDMTTPAPIEAAMRRFERLMDEFEKLLEE